VNEEHKAHCITITIVGAVIPPLAADQLQLLFERVGAILQETMPDFLPANPSVTIVTSELRDDWIKH
jgi:hypothetical protein